jgi:hypothetical protein
MYLVLFNVLSIKAQADSPIVHKSLTLIGREHVQIKDWSLDNHVTFGTRPRELELKKFLTKFTKCLRFSFKNYSFKYKQ